MRRKQRDRNIKLNQYPSSDSNKFWLYASKSLNERKCKSLVITMRYRFHLEAIKRLPGHRVILSRLLPNFCQLFVFFFSARSNVFLCSACASFCFSNKHETFKLFGATTAGEAKVPRFVWRWRWKKWMWPVGLAAGSVIASQAGLGRINGSWCMCLHICVSSTFSELPSRQQQSRLSLICAWLFALLLWRQLGLWGNGMFGCHGD